MCFWRLPFALAISAESYFQSLGALARRSGRMLAYKGRSIAIDKMASPAPKLQPVNKDHAMCDWSEVDGHLGSGQERCRQREASRCASRENAVVAPRR